MATPGPTPTLDQRALLVLGFGVVALLLGLAVDLLLASVVGFAAALAGMYLVVESLEPDDLE